MSRTVGLPTRTMGVHRAWLSPTRLAKSLPWAGIALEQPFSILRNPPLIAHQLPSAYKNLRNLHQDVSDRTPPPYIFRRNCLYNLILYLFLSSTSQADALYLSITL